MLHNIVYYLPSLLPMTGDDNKPDFSLTIDDLLIFIEKKKKIS